MSDPTASATKPAPASADRWLAEPPPALPGTFGRYQLTRRLGGGTTGVVYLAQDPRQNREVAVKLLRPGPAEGQGQRLRDLRAVANLSHPGICKIHVAGQHDGIYYLSLDAVAGRSLGDLLRSGTPVGPRQALEWVAQVARALQYAHEQGAYHRDLKPANVLLTDRGQAVLTDFGLNPGGTPGYQAPEGIRGGAPAGAAADVYALGVTLFELVAGRKPFEGDAEALRRQALDTAPPRPSRFRKGVLRGIDEACLRALARNPKERFGSMAEFAAALEALLKPAATVPGDASPVTLCLVQKAEPPEPDKPEPPPSRLRKLGTWTTIVIWALALTASLTIFLLMTVFKWPR